MRTVWSELLGDPALLRRGYSLDTVAEELIFVAGPLLAGLTAGLATLSLGVVAGAGLVVAGTLAFVSTGPVRALHTAVAGARERPRAGFAVAQPGVAALGIGACLGAGELLMVAFARQHHHAAAAAWCAAALSAGSVVGGLVHGALPWRLPGRARLHVL